MRAGQDLRESALKALIRGERLSCVARKYCIDKSILIALSKRALEGIKSSLDVETDDSRPREDICRDFVKKLRKLVK